MVVYIRERGEVGSKSEVGIRMVVYIRERGEKGNKSEVVCLH